MGCSVSVDEVMQEVRRDAPFFRRSGGGVTFSGGEPLSQPLFLLECLRRCRRWGYHTAVETCGYARWDDLEEAAGLTDLFLFDIKLVDPLRHERLTGVRNELIVDNLERLLALGAAVVVRVPVLPGVNDDRESMRALGEFVAGRPAVRTVELLPGHELGAHKYAALDLAAPTFGAPLRERLVSDAAEIERGAHGVECRVAQGLS